MPASGPSTCLGASSHSTYVSPTRWEDAEWMLLNSLSSHSLCQCAYLLFFKSMAILHGKIELKTLSAFASWWTTLTLHGQYYWCICQGPAFKWREHHGPRRWLWMKVPNALVNTADCYAQKTFAHTESDWEWVYGIRFASLLQSCFRKSFASFSFKDLCVYQHVNINPGGSGWWLGNERL